MADTNENTSPVWKNKSSYEKAQFLMKHKPDCDFSIGRKLFQCHKSILSGASPVFQAMFNGSAEGANSNYGCMQISNAEATDFKRLLDFIYYNEVDSLKHVSMRSLKNLMQLSNYYQISALSSACLKILRENVEGMDNVDLIRAFEYGYLQSDKQLIRKSSEMILKRTKSSIFRDVNKEDKKQRSAEQQPEMETPSPKAQTAPIPLHKAAPIGLFGQGPSVSSSDIFRCSLSRQSSVVSPPGSQFGSGNLFSQTSKPVAFFNAYPAQDHGNVLGNNRRDSEKSAADSKPDSQDMLRVSKTHILDCLEIHDLNECTFYEFLKLLSGAIAEIDRYNLIETYARINHLVNDENEEAKTSGIIPNADGVNTISEENSQHDSIEQTPDLNTSGEVTAYLRSYPQILNMMLKTINFYDMGAKEFCGGPGKSNLLNIDEKYEILSGIIHLES